MDVSIGDIGVAVAEIGRGGPRGLKGEPGVNTALIENVTAGENVSGHRVVYKLSDEVFYADKDTPLTLKTILGVTSGAVVAGDVATVVTAGLITEPSWSWNFPALIFLGETGQLTQTPPVSGNRVIVGSASSETTMQVRIRESIILI